MLVPDLHLMHISGQKELRWKSVGISEKSYPRQEIAWSGFGFKASGKGIRLLPNKISFAGTYIWLTSFCSPEFNQIRPNTLINFGASIHESNPPPGR